MKEHGGGSTDSEDPAAIGIKEASRRKRQKGQTNQRESKSKTAGHRSEEGQGLEVSQRPTATEKCKEPSAKREQTKPHTKPPRSNKTGRALGKRGVEKQRRVKIFSSVATK